MNKQPHLPAPDESRRHYRVPEGYFDDLEARIMAHLPEEAPAEELAVPSVSLWTRLRPIAYLAAMFVSMNLIFRAFSPPLFAGESCRHSSGRAACRRRLCDLLRRLRRAYDGCRWL